MSSASVFVSLRELFPQVDARILRAISIEHRDDINEAVEYILSEFSLNDATTSVPHTSPEGSKGVEHIAVPKDNPTSLDMLRCIGEAENNELHSFVSDSTEEPGLLPPQSLNVDANPRSKQRLEASDHNNNLSLNITHLPEKVDEVTFSNADNQQLCLEPHSGQMFDEVILAEHRAKFSDGLECANSSQHVNLVETCHHEDNISVNFVDQTSLSTVYDKSGSTIACRPLNLLDLETAVNTQTAHTSMLSVSAVDENDQIYQDCAAEEYTNIIDSENQNLISFDENSTELLSNENENSNILLLSLPTRSGHIVATELLEDSIRDAKNSKKTLLSTLESMANKMQEVELLEEKAKQVKADSVVANHDILFKVEELQNILKQSKDENDMHAGEVYGERSILAAEARELQSRLLKMSEERNEYLSITEELFRSLEARKAAAESEIAAAELEMLERGKVDHESLKDHELTMDSVLAESQKLQQEAEENSKLREFLMDRGRVVDSLQGEIAIICEDILSMKLKVDGGHTPIGKYLPSYSDDHRPSALSSSTTSLTKEIPEKLPIVKDTTDRANLIGVGRISLDDWELCET
ncbi:hypothetical protein KSP39_PZI017310 [Platanthera zijinensis]|uniref:CUE domain-containing protein n=1 Tax=Platanthera zijinensis TaxID=2320716 RepID=A0AAP0B4U4_9ASPA